MKRFAATLLPVAVLVSEYVSERVVEGRLRMTIRAAVLLVVFLPLTLRAQVDIFWNQDGIRRANIDGSNQRSVISRMGDFPVAIAFDRASGYVFWSEFDGRIRRVDADRIVFETIAEVDSVVGLAVDETQGKLYWVVGGSSPAIRRSNLNGSDVETIVSSGLNRPLGIRVDPSNDAIYWSDMNRQDIYGSGVGTVSRARLDGSSIEQVVADSGLIGMTIDVEENFLYWSASRSRIRRASLDGTNPETILDGENESSPDFYGSGIPQPLRIDLDASTNTVYWMSRGQDAPGWNLGIIASRSVDGGTIRVVGGASWPITYPPYSSLEGPFAVPFDLKINPETGQVAWTYQGAEPVGNPDPTTSFRFTGAGVHDHKPDIIKVSRSTGEVFWSDDTYQTARVYRANLDGAAESYVFREIGEGLNDFLYHAAARTFYASDNRWGLYVFREEEGSERDIPGVGGQSMALDTVDNKLYWIDGSRKIGRQNLDGSSVEPLVELGDCNPYQNDVCPDDLNLDLAGGRMYWRSGNSIQTATLDGTDVRAVLAESSPIRSFTADWIDRKLYWISAGMLRRSNPDGSEAEDLWPIGDDASELQILNPKVAIAIPMDPAACYDHGGDWEILAGETFENAWPGAWEVRRDGNVDAVWGTSRKRVARGEKSVWPAAWGSQAGGPEGLYKNGQDTWMTLGPFDLRNTSGAKFRFDRWVDTEAGDELQWGASTDGVNFTTVDLSGSDPQWKRDGYSMARPASQKLLGESTVWIGFRFKSNATGRREGPYVDNICVERLSDTVALNAAPVPESPENASTDVGLTPVLAWNYLTGALAYELQIAADEGFTNVRRSITTNGLDYGVPYGDLAKGTTYWWRVRGRNHGSTGPWSTTWSFMTESDAPHVPLLSSPGVDAPSESTSLLLQWHASESATAYDVQVAGDDTFAGLHMDTTVSQLEIEFVAPFVETEFFWRARARGMGGLSDWSEVRRFTTASSGPLVAVLRTPTHDADGISEDADLEWSSAPAAQGYRVQVADDGGFGSSGKSSAVVVDTVVADTTYRVAGLGSGRVHFWRVAGIDGLGRFTWSAESRFTTLGAPGRSVTLVTPLEGSEGEPAFARFVWRVLDEAHAYHLQIDADARFLMPVVDDSTLIDTTFAPQSPLAYNSRYFWRVRARNAAGSGSWSEIRTFTVAVGTAAEYEVGLPTAFALHPNYPNPFNVTTVFELDLPESRRVRLTVFDILGRNVADLVDGDLFAGRHRVSLDAGDWADGRYLVRMTAGDFQVFRSFSVVR